MAPSVPDKDVLVGRVGNLTPEQAEMLKKFKAELAIEGFFKEGTGPEKADMYGGGLTGASHDDATLLRFLRARKFDLAKSKLMFIDCEKWRKEFKVDELYNTFEYPEKKDVDAIYPQFYHKTDQDGRPLYIEQLGKLDLTKLYKVTTPERQLQRLVVEYERFLRDRLPVCSMEHQKLIETSCTIMDLQGVGLSQFWKVKNYVQQASHLSQNYYPETMGKFYIINSPYLFSTVWNWVKPWLDEVTVKKIQILDSSYQKTLLLQIPAESLPKTLKGKCECTGGCSMSDAGPWKDSEVVAKAKSLKAGPTTAAPAIEEATPAAVAATPVEQPAVPAAETAPAPAAAAEAPAS
ncbi:cytosolic factor, phosphatidylinositol/phosphatidylcholine transfer protein [Puccinia graminis f. sp. tritici]|uniref:Cytosolic factor, phosphatidylinositol/phosphatidylcholine transfer protein n=1 Tax=Puccinia graminis f. sp. tritici TaxID=56615 RepID=A0A5B0MH32_PUCGR|nr:cytosolic factor, phosphatidylinositol/phosphatidylcholine transfer protein [Puccinia graminis f. sp. tritici]